MKFYIYIFNISRVGPFMVFAPFSSSTLATNRCWQAIIRYETKSDCPFASTITCDNYLFENILKTREL